MAATLNTILSDESSEPIFSPMVTAKEQIQANNAQAIPVSDSVLAEIHAIQEALINDVDFDFSTLEPTAAGDIQSYQITQSNDKSSGSPILLEDPGLLIHYRSDDQTTTASINNEVNTPDSEIVNEADSDSVLTTINTNNVSQIQASVSEDFITQAQGQLAENLNISAQSFETQFGSFSLDSTGQWQYSLNNQLTEVQSLASGEIISELINLTSSTGQQLQISIEINGSNDQAIITGTKQGEIQAAPIEELGKQEIETHPSIKGKLNVSDIDLGEARFQTSFDIQGNFGSAQINAQGEWTYTLNNNADAVLGLRAGEKLLDMFSVKTLDGTKQLIQINIEGANDKPLLSGNNVAELDLSSSMETHGSLLINDPDFGESSFQVLTSIRSSLGYGSADIDAQGNWSFNLDIEFAKLHTINEGQTRIDSFEVFTMDGTSQMINIPIKGSDTPAYEQGSSSQSLALHELLHEESQDDEIAQAFSQDPEAYSAMNTSTHATQASGSENIQSTLFLNSDHETLHPVNPHLNDINIS